jgi:preprotein translocase subunit SecA
MSFWSWLCRKQQDVEVADDLIWVNETAKFAGLQRAVEKLCEEGVFVVVVAHFPKTLARIKQSLGKQTSEGARLSVADVVRRAGEAPGFCVVLATALAAEDVADQAVVDPGSVPILVAERHFLRMADDTIVDFARSLPTRCRVTFYLSLQDPLLRTFSGDRIERLLTSLGMKESEPIQASMVARRIKGAQRAFADRAGRDISTDSAAEWLERNARG